MNRPDHVLNAVLLSIGIGFVMEPAGDAATFRLVAAMSLPLVLGALFPDIDLFFGEHRKTLHNLPVLVLFYAWPAVFANLEYVWLGVATHYVLDLFGTRRGLALLYPWHREFELPIGVPADSRTARLVTVLVSLGEIYLVLVLVREQVPVQDLTRGGLAGLGLL